ncbi:MAG: hypothetical protein RKE49_07060 [Oceanicaulis sp.]
MIIRLACAALAAAGLGTPVLAVNNFEDVSGLPGTYRAEAGSACRLRLDPPAEAPEDSLVQADTVTGLVLAFPGCPAGLSDALAWRAPADGSALILIDGSGAVILHAAPDEKRGWTGETPGGETVTLLRD